MNGMTNYSEGEKVSVRKCLIWNTGNTVLLELPFCLALPGHMGVHGGYNVSVLLHLSYLQ